MAEDIQAVRGKVPGLPSLTKAQIVFSPTGKVTAKLMASDVSSFPVKITEKRKAGT